MMQKMSPCWWFNHQAEEAVNCYVSIFKNTGLGNIIRFGYDSMTTVNTIDLETE